MGDAQGLVGVLFHQEDRGAVGVDALDDLEDLLDDDGREAQRGLVQQEQLGPGHEGAADGQHLLFATGQGAAGLLAALGQDGEEVEHIVHVFLDALHVVAQEGAQVEVLAHAQVGEDEAAFGHLRDAQADDLVRGQLVDGLAVPEDLALARPVDAADGHECGGLAGAVGTDEGHDLAVIHAQGNVAQGLDVAVVGINALDFKHLRFLPDRPE